MCVYDGENVYSFKGASDGANTGSVAWRARILAGTF